MKRTRVNPVSLKRGLLNLARKEFRRRILEERMFCEARIVGCSWTPTDVHEIVSRARGGSIIDESNVSALCRPCHQFITENPAWGTENGFLLHANPSEADKFAAQRARASFVYGLDDSDVGDD